MQMKLSVNASIQQPELDTLTSAKDTASIISMEKVIATVGEIRETADSMSGRFVTIRGEAPASFDPQPIPRATNEWQVFVLSFSVLIIAFVRISGKNFFRNLYSGLISRPIFRQLLRDGQLLPRAAKLPLLFTFLLVITVFVFQLNGKLTFISFPEYTGTTMNVLIVFVLFGIFEVLRFILIRITGFIFRTGWVAREFITNNIFFHTLSTLLVLPLLIISIYARTDLILFFAAGIIGFLFIFRLMRGLLIAFEVKSYSGYQIFLYLCALEILPVFILIKVLTGYVSRI